MTYDIKPLSFDPKEIKGLSEKLLVSHYENNYSGAVKRLNAITAQLAELDFAKASVFVTCWNLSGPKFCAIKVFIRSGLWTAAATISGATPFAVRARADAFRY